MIAATPGDLARRPIVARRMVRLPRFQSRGNWSNHLGRAVSWRTSACPFLSTSVGRIRRPTDTSLRPGDFLPYAGCNISPASAQTLPPALAVASPFVCCSSARISSAFASSSLGLLDGMALPHGRYSLGKLYRARPVVHADAMGQARAGGEVGDLERGAASTEKRGCASGNQRALRVGNSNAGAVLRGIADTRH